MLFVSPDQNKNMRTFTDIDQSFKKVSSLSSDVCAETNRVHDINKSNLVFAANGASGSREFVRCWCCCAVNRGRGWQGLLKLRTLA
jgi:hypothetical protein